MNTPVILTKTLFIASFIFISCADHKKEPSHTPEPKAIINADSLQLLQNEIISSRNEINAAFDSLQLYHLNKFNDTCVKFLYLIYHDSYIERGNIQLTLGQCAIKPTRVNRLDKALFQVKYDTFLYDSIPGHPQIDSLMGDYSIPLRIDFDTVRKRPIEFYIGQYRYANAEAFYKWYRDTLTSESFKNYLKDNENNLSQDFRRLIKLD
jgi:hypothetical protein